MLAQMLHSQYAQMLLPNLYPNISKKHAHLAHCLAQSSSHAVPQSRLMFRWLHHVGKPVWHKPTKLWDGLYTYKHPAGLLIEPTLQ